MAKHVKKAILVTGLGTAGETPGGDGAQAIYVDGVLAAQEPGGLRMRDAILRLPRLYGAEYEPVRLVDMERLQAVRGTLEFPERLADLDAIDGIWVPLPPDVPGLIY